MSDRLMKFVLIGIIAGFLSMFFTFCIRNIIQTNHQEQICHAKGNVAVISRDEGYSGVLCVRKDGFVK